MNDIKSYRNWLVWRIKSEPTSALTGQRKAWQNNLATYSEAYQFCQDHEGYQLGVCFTEDFPYIGLDIDGGRNPETGELTDWASSISLTWSWGFYANVSVSGTGLKRIIPCSRKLKRGVKKIKGEGFGDHDPQVELFTSSKYFALTTTSVEDFPEEKEPTTSDFECLEELMGYDIFDIEPPKSSQASNGGETSTEDLQQLLAKLDIHDYTHRDDWIRIMSACHHATGGSLEGLLIFSGWSSFDADKFDQGDTERDWESMNPNPTNPINLR